MSCDGDDDEDEGEDDCQLVDLAMVIITYEHERAGLADTRAGFAPTAPASEGVVQALPAIEGLRL